MITEYIVGTSKKEQRGVNNVPKSRYWGGKAPDWVDEDASGAPGVDLIRCALIGPHLIRCALIDGPGMMLRRRRACEERAAHEPHQVRPVIWRYDHVHMVPVTRTVRNYEHCDAVTTRG
jgi:hypothetical protein